jgi:hypothetical protein
METPMTFAPAILGAQGRDDLDLRLEVHPPLTLVEVRDVLAQVEEALGDRVPLVPFEPRGLGELVHHDLGRGIVGVAHGQVDDVDPVAAEAVLPRVDLAEEIRRQPVHPARGHRGQVDGQELVRGEAVWDRDGVHGFLPGPAKDAHAAPPLQESRDTESRAAGDDRL